MNQEFGSVCHSEYKSKSDNLKSVRHLEKMGQFFCSKKCRSYMKLSDKTSHLSSNEHEHPNPSNERNKDSITTGLVVNAATYVNYKFCPGENIQHQLSQILSQKYYPYSNPK